jgi:hypothetical protein
MRPPHLQNSPSKIDWTCGSSSGAPALQVQSSEFKPSPIFKKMKELYTEKNKTSRTEDISSGLASRPRALGRQCC